MRKCRNWQTSKTKDLVIAISCGFKSHLPHSVLPFADDIFLQEWRNWQTRRLQVPVVAISCGFKSHLLHERKEMMFSVISFSYIKGECGYEKGIGD